MTERISFCPVRFRRYATELSLAVHEMGRISELQAALQIPSSTPIVAQSEWGGINHYITLDGRKAVRLKAMATADEIKAALLPQIDIIEAEIMETIGQQLKAAKAQIAETRMRAASAVTATAEATSLVNQKVDETLKEAADLRAEVAELTNGGPALNGQETPA